MDNDIFWVVGWLSETNCGKLECRYSEHCLAGSCRCYTLARHKPARVGSWTPDDGPIFYFKLDIYTMHHIPCSSGRAVKSGQ